MNTHNTTLNATWHFTVKYMSKTTLETGCNNEPENNPANPDDELPVDIVIEKPGDSWTDTFRADFIFGSDNINRLDEIDRDGHDDANQGFGRPGPSSNNPYRAPPQTNERKRPASGWSGSELMPSRRFKR